MTASSAIRRSAPGSIATTLLDSKFRTLLTMCAFRRAPRFTGWKSRDCAEVIIFSRFMPDADASRLATSRWIHDATFKAEPSAFKNDFSPELEFLTTSHG